MCTVSWIREDHGYHLFCNRDEKRTRKPALPPTIAARNGVRFLAPVDGDFGGTWIATNELGVSICLLNAGSGPASRSRGLLVLDLAPLESVVNVVNGIRELDLSSYAPFTLVAIEPGASPAVVEWSGSRIAVSCHKATHIMLTSSSFDSGRVREKRRLDYTELTSTGCNAALLEKFHRSHGAAPSAYSVCMHRPDAETMSFSHIHVFGRQIEFTYFPSAPCRNSHPLVSSLTIARPVAVR